MADKSIKVTLLLPKSLWTSDLLRAAGAAGMTRAKFVRRSLTLACQAKGVQVVPTVDTSGLFTHRPAAAPAPQRPIAPTAEVPEFDPDVWYLAYIKAGEDRDDAEYSVRDECEKRGISGWVVPNEEAAI